MSKHQESFPVLSVSREDVTRAMGYNLGAVLSDDQMRMIASGLGDALSEVMSLGVGFWGTLASVVESRLETEEGTSE